MQFIRRPETRSHVVFLSDYDMLLTEHLVQGVDVWINTPRRHPPSVTALPITAQREDKSSIGSIAWKRNGVPCASVA
jgi:hypothetical protein